MVVLYAYALGSVYAREDYNALPYGHVLDYVQASQIVLGDYLDHWPDDWASDYRDGYRDTWARLVDLDGGPGCKVRCDE